jgi:hypothetical protein
MGKSNEDVINEGGRPEESEIEDITNEASLADSDTILRQTLRGDETKGDPNDRDHVGATRFEDTPHGREETKNENAGAANQNG